MAEQANDKPTNSLKFDPNKDQSECLRILNLVLDGEADNKEREFFEKQLQNCMPYYEIYNVDMAIKELIKKNGHAHTCPDGLIEEIKAKIKSPAPKK